MKTKHSLGIVGCLGLLALSCGAQKQNGAQKTAPPSANSPRTADSANAGIPPETIPPREEDPDAVYQMRQMHLIEWIDKAKRDCERLKDIDAYLPEREGFPPEEIALVKKRCAEAVEVGMRGTAWRRAMSACADRFVQAKGQGKHECRLTPKDVPDLPPEMFDRHKAGCAVACTEVGMERMERNKERAQFVRCCDGTTSPSCTYGNLRADCCAGHQGICIPD